MVNPDAEMAVMFPIASGPSSPEVPPEPLEPACPEQFPVLEVPVSLTSSATSADPCWWNLTVTTSHVCTPAAANLAADIWSDTSPAEVRIVSELEPTAETTPLTRRSPLTPALEAGAGLIETEVPSVPIVAVTSTTRPGSTAGAVAAATAIRARLRSA
jgi:hypothetical protein